MIGSRVTVLALAACLLLSTCGLGQLDQGQLTGGPPPAADGPSGQSAVSSEPEPTPAGSSPGGAGQAAGQPDPRAPSERTGEEAAPVALPVGRVPVAARDPARLAQQITLAERTIRSDDHTPEEAAAAGHLQQVAYRRLADRPEWRDHVLARVPPGLRPSVRAHTEAVAGLASLHDPRDELPAWRIVPPPPAERLLAYYREAEQVFGVPWEYLAAINLVETRMGRIEGTSSAGAQGPMQFMPATWAAYGQGSIHNHRDAVLAAGRYLAANGAPQHMHNALFAYNRSRYYVQAVATYAEQMQADPGMFRGYYHWEVYYSTTSGDRLLPIGYDGSG